MCRVPLGRGFKFEPSLVGGFGAPVVGDEGGEVGLIGIKSSRKTSFSGPKADLRFVNSIISAGVARSSKSPIYRTIDRPSEGWISHV
jgi:hypothetical protein